jgi:hypothetical protein
MAPRVKMMNQWNGVHALNTTMAWDVKKNEALNLPSGKLT